MDCLSPATDAQRAYIWQNEAKDLEEIVIVPFEILIYESFKQNQFVLGGLLVFGAGLIRYSIKKLTQSLEAEVARLHGRLKCRRTSYAGKRTCSAA